MTEGEEVLNLWKDHVNDKWERLWITAIDVGYQKLDATDTIHAIHYFF